MSPPLPINRPMGAIEWLLLITLSVLWGGTFLCSEVALEEVRPFTLVLARVGLAAIVLLAVSTPRAIACPAAWPHGCRSWSWARSTT